MLRLVEATLMASVFLFCGIVAVSAAMAVLIGVAYIIDMLV